MITISQAGCPLSTLELASGAASAEMYLKKTCCISFGTGVRALGGPG